jgi:hypothetical protein
VDIQIDFAKMTPEDLVKAFDIAKKSVGMLRMLASLTPTKYDDQTLLIAEQAIAAVEPYAKEQWFLDLIQFVFSLLKRGDGPDNIVKFLSQVAALGKAE